LPTDPVPAFEGPRPVPRPEWSPLPQAGCVGVEGKVLMRVPLVLALLRFEPGGTIHEHPAEIDADVVCLEGEGFTSLAGKVFPLRAGETIPWPRGISHRLWTETSTMTTLMVEHAPDRQH
jgi:quercetin dioxygenase-like cupin family protein